MQFAGEAGCSRLGPQCGRDRLSGSACAFGEREERVSPEPLTIAVDEAVRVSALLQVPQGARACYVLAHGAGAGMAHPFMTSVADELSERGIATLRYQFPYMEEGRKRPDQPKTAHAAVRAAVAQASRLVPGLSLLAGGKSFGGRMTSQAQAAAPLQRVCGLVFLGFHCTLPVTLHGSAQNTCSMCESRCSSCKGRATRLPIFPSSSRFARRWGRGRH